MQVLIFNEFGLKMPIQAPKMEYFGDLTSKCHGEQPDHDPKKVLSCTETRHYDLQIVKIGSSVIAQLIPLPNPQNPMLCNGPSIPLKLPF